MKHQKNVVIKKGCHSRTSLSGIYNACRCKIKDNSLLNRCVEDPRVLRTAKSGMTPNLMGFTLRPSSSRSVSMRDIGAAPRGFTLIELLVVVLIIGILAAVALPQYQKAVMKSRATQAILFFRNAGQAMDRWVLENSAPNETVTFIGTKANGQLDVELTGGMQCGNSSCSDGNFEYAASWEQTFGYIFVGYQFSFDSIKDTFIGAMATADKHGNNVSKSCSSYDADGAKFCAALCSLDSGFC